MQDAGRLLGAGIDRHARAQHVRCHLQEFDAQMGDDRADMAGLKILEVDDTHATRRARGAFGISGGGGASGGVAVSHGTVVIIATKRRS